MRALCKVCGADMTGCRASQKYCSTACSKMSVRLLIRQAKAEQFADRRCETCAAPMPVTMRADARWCSLECKRASGPNYYRGTRHCGWCGAAFRAVNRDQATCSISCGQKLRQSRRKG